MFAVLKAGNKPRIVTSRAEKLDARDIVVALCDGSYEQHSRPKAASTQPTRTIRQRAATQTQNTTYAAAVPRATHIAGPGSGHKVERVTSEDPLSEVERVLKRPKVTDDEW